MVDTLLSKWGYFLSVMTTFLLQCFVGSDNRDMAFADIVFCYLRVCTINCINETKKITLDQTNCLAKVTRILTATQHL